MRPSFLEEMSWAMGEVYAEVVDRILINLAHYFPYIQDGAEPKGSFEYQARMLAQMGKVNQETIGIIKGSLQGADAALKDGLEAAIRDALKNEEPKLRQAAERGMLKGEGFLPPEVDPSQMQAFKSYYRQSADKLNLVNTVMLESTQQAYRATVSDIVSRVETTQRILNTATGEVVTGVSTWNQAMRGAVDRMVENGLTGFVDHAGHHWRPETYAVMDIRSTMFNTARAAVWERNEQYGNDLYQVSSHNGARPLCYPWQGKIISRADRSGTVEDLDGNKIEIIPQSQTSYGQAAGLFGVNCKHYPMTFIPGVSTLRGQPQDPEENEKTYAESQEQRRLERKLREKRLKVEQLKAQGAPEEEIRAAKAKAKEASDRVQDFCDETGRTRRRNREGTPVIASWAGASFPADTELLHKQPTHQKISDEGRKIIPEPLYRKLVNPVIKAGGDVERGTEFAERHLRDQGAYASHIAGKIFFKKDCTISDVLEETYHFYQERSGKYLKYDEPEYTLRIEIDAKKRLLSLAERYKIPIEETELTKSELQTYEGWLEEWLASHLPQT